MIDRVKISKEFTGLWIGMESSVDVGSTPEQAYAEMEESVIRCFNKTGQNHGAIIPETNLADVRNLERLEDLFNEKKDKLKDFEMNFAQRVIDQKEKSSYTKLIKMLELK